MWISNRNPVANDINHLQCESVRDTLNLLI